MMHRKAPIVISITPGTIVAGIAIGLAFWVAFLLRDLLLVVLTAVVFASAIEPMTRWFMHHGLPRVLSVVLIYLSALFLIVSFFYFFLPPLMNETTDFFKALPTYLETLDVASHTTSVVHQESASLVSQILQLQDVLKTSSVGVLSTANYIFGGLMSFILIIVLSFYIAVQERGLDSFIRLISPTQHHNYILDLWERAQVKIGRWLQGQLLLSLIVGVFVYVGLLFFGVPYALLLAILAGILELIPVFGSILAAIPAVTIAFIDSGATMALLIIVLFIIINQIEGNVIYPMVVQKVLGVPPLVIILAIIAGAQLAGFLGTLIAVPVAAAVREWVSDVQRGKQQLVYTAEDGTIV